MKNHHADHIIHWGLDHPDIVGFWEPNELILVSTAFMLFILIHAVLIGWMICLILLMMLPKLKNHTVRGHQDHFLWKIGLLTHKGFQHFPPSAITQFEN